MSSIADSLYAIFEIP